MKILGLFLLFFALSTSAFAQYPANPLAIPLTDGATITVPCPIGGSVTYTLTLTGSNHKINFPTCTGSSNNADVIFLINSGNNSGSSYTGLTLDTKFNWTGGFPYTICTGAATPNPACPAAELASQKDAFGCKVIGTTAASTEWDCFTPQYNIFSPVFQAVAGATNNCASSSGAACTTGATNMTGVTLIVGCIGYFNTDGSASTLSDSLSNSYTQVYSTADGAVTGRLFYSKPSSVSGTMTFTASDTGGSTDASPGLTVMGFSGPFTTPLDQSANAAAGTTVTSLQPGSITPTQANELLVSCLSITTSTTGGIAINSPFTLGPVQNSVSGNSYGSALGYQIQAPGPNAENPTWSWTGSGRAVAGQASFK